MTTALRAVKGHGTENDFILIEDLDAVLSLSPSLVRALCDRHSGIGADGVLRVVRTTSATEPDVRAQAGRAEYFMDYRNADGSIAEMCGNGVRVFARYLQTVGLAGDRFAVATRGGLKEVSSDGDSFRVDMGPSAFRSEQPSVSVGTDTGRTEVKVLAAVDMPNPHVVAEVADLEALEALDLSRPPAVAPPLPEGQNVEFVVRTGPRSLRMRVHERGVGETRSCGTGICAAVVAAADPGDLTGEWQVEIPGGTCTVSWSDSCSVVLTGPAVLVGTVDLDRAWLAEHR